MISPVSGSVSLIRPTDKPATCSFNGMPASIKAMLPIKRKCIGLNTGYDWKCNKNRLLLHQIEYKVPERSWGRPAQTDAIDVDPSDAMTSELIRTVYGQSSSGGITASSAFSARVPENKDQLSNAREWVS